MLLLALYVAASLTAPELSGGMLAYWRGVWPLMLAGDLGVIVAGYTALWAARYVR